MTIISETSDEILRRCLWTLRRLWYLPIVLGLILGGGVFLARDQAYQATVNFFVVPNSPTLEAAELAPGLLSELAPIDADAGALQGAARQAAAPHGKDISVSVRTSTGQDRRSFLTAVIKGPTPKAIEAARVGTIESFMARRMERVNAAVQSAVTSLIASKASLEGQIKDLDARSPAPGMQTVSGGRSGDRSDLGVKLAETNAKIGALQQVVSKPDEIVQVAGQSAVRPVGGRTVSAMAAAALGVLIALGAIYVLGYRDRRIRSRRDLVRTVDVAVLGVLPDGGYEPAIARLAAVIGAVVSAEGSKTVDFIPVGVQTGLERLADMLADDPSLKDHVTVRARRHLDEEPGTLQVDGPCVVVARFAHTDRDDIEHTVEDLLHSGRQLLGIVLIDVPHALLAWANRSPRSFTD
jgi:hypothetical protein